MEPSATSFLSSSKIPFVRRPILGPLSTGFLPPLVDSDTQNLPTTHKHTNFVERSIHWGAYARLVYISPLFCRCVGLMFFFSASVPLIALARRAR